MTVYKAIKPEAETAAAAACDLATGKTAGRDDGRREQRHRGHPVGPAGPGRGHRRRRQRHQVGPGHVVADKFYGADTARRSATRRRSGLPEPARSRRQVGRHAAAIAHADGGGLVPPPSAAAARVTHDGDGTGTAAAMEGISKAFGAVQALTDVGFDVYAGEVVALVGDNGAGKSTLIKVIAGHLPRRRRRRSAGRAARSRSAARRTPPRSGIATVYQDLALCDNLDVVANLFLGRETRAGGGPLSLLDEVDDGDGARSRCSRRLSVQDPQRRARRSPRSRAASASPSRSPARCSASPRSCSSTSRPRPSAWPRRARSST